MTATLRSRITELRDLVAGREREASEGFAIGKARQAAERLTDVAVRADGVLGSVRELAAADVVLDDAPSPELLAGALADAREQTAEDGLYPGRGDLPGIVTVIRSHTDQLQAAVDRAWTAVKVENRAPIIDDELLDLAGDEDPGIVHRVERARTQLMVLQERARPEAGDVELLVTAVADLRALAMQVAEQAPSQSVIAFVRAASSHDGATVDQLNDPQVASWLADGDRSGRYVVRARAHR